MADRHRARQVHVVATGKDAAAFDAAEKLVAELEERGIEVIYDDRKKVSRASSSRTPS